MGCKTTRENVVEPEEMRNAHRGGDKKESVLEGNAQEGNIPTHDMSVEDVPKQSDKKDTEVGLQKSFVKVLILFYSTYSHVYQMAKAYEEVVKKVEGAIVDVMQVPEILSEEILQKMNAVEVRKSFDYVPVISDPMVLTEYDAIIFGTPTRFGNPSAQMCSFFDRLGSVWSENLLVGKVAGVFTSTGSQHGGNESTNLSLARSLLHLGFIIAGVPSTFKGMFEVDQVVGHSPYGGSTIAGADGSRIPSEIDLDGARFHGQHIAQIAKKLGK